MMRGLVAGAMLAFALSGVAKAEPQSERLFTHKNWMVEIVAFDDDSIACVAQVTDGDDTFSVDNIAFDGLNLYNLSTLTTQGGTPGEIGG